MWKDSRAEWRDSQPECSDSQPEWRDSRTEWSDRRAESSYRRAEWSDSSSAPPETGDFQWREQRKPRHDRLKRNQQTEREETRDGSNVRYNVPTSNYFDFLFIYICFALHEYNQENY